MRQVCGSIPGSVKSDAVANGLSLLRRSCVAQTLSRGDGPRSLLHVFAQYREYNEDVILQPALSIDIMSSLITQL